MLWSTVRASISSEWGSKLKERSTRRGTKFILRLACGVVSCVKERTITKITSSSDMLQRRFRKSSSTRIVLQIGCSTVMSIMAKNVLPSKTWLIYFPCRCSLTLNHLFTLLMYKIVTAPATRQYVAWSMYGGYSILLPWHGKQDEYDGVRRTQMLLVVHLIDHQGCSPLLHTGQGRDISFDRCPISFRITFWYARGITRWIQFMTCKTYSYCSRGYCYEQ